MHSTLSESAPLRAPRSLARTSLEYRQFRASAAYRSKLGIPRAAVGTNDCSKGLSMTAVEIVEEVWPAEALYHPSVHRGVQYIQGEHLTSVRCPFEQRVHDAEWSRVSRYQDRAGGGRSDR